MMVLETYENRNVFEIYNLQFLKPIIVYISFITIFIIQRFSIHKYSFNISVLIRMAYWNIMILDIDVNIHIYPFVVSSLSADPTAR